MRYLTLNIADGLELSIDNSFSGVETIYLNDEEVSKKFSFWGAEHSFSRTENGENVDYTVKIGLNFTGIGYDISRNGEPILLSNTCQNHTNFSGLGVLMYLILFVASGFLGYTLTRGVLDGDYGFTKAIIPAILCIGSGFYFYWRKYRNYKQS